MDTSSRELRFAVIGAGGIANWHIDAITGRPGVVLVGASDTSSAALERVAARKPGIVTNTDFRAMLDACRPDIVSVCTPNRFHREIVLAAFAAGAHVMCEKPMAMDLAEAVEMEEARRRAGKVGMINFSYRNCESFRFARSLIASGELGRVTRVNAVYLQSFLGGNTGYSWRNDKSLAGFGALGDLGIHMIDGVRFLTGLEYVSVVGRAQTLIPTRRDAAGVERPVTTDTNAAFLAELQGGPLAVFETTQVAPGYGNHFRIEVSGTQGTLSVLSERGEEINWSGGAAFGRTTTWKTSFAWLPVPTELEGLRSPKTPEAIVHVVRGEQIPYASFEDGVAAQRVLEAVVRSGASGRWESAGA